MKDKDISTTTIAPNIRSKLENSISNYLQHIFKRNELREDLVPDEHVIICFVSHKQVEFLHSVERPVHLSPERPPLVRLPEDFALVFFVLAIVLVERIPVLFEVDFLFHFVYLFGCFKSLYVPLDPYVYSGTEIYLVGGIG